MCPEAGHNNIRRVLKVIWVNFSNTVNVLCRKGYSCSCNGLSCKELQCYYKIDINGKGSTHVLQWARCDYAKLQQISAHALTCCLLSLFFLPSTLSVFRACVKIYLLHGFQNFNELFCFCWLKYSCMSILGDSCWFF